MTSNKVGEIIMYNSIIEPLNWIICDGIQRDNMDNKYKDLFDLGIGKIDGDYYIPPNYCNSIMANINDNDSQILKQIDTNSTVEKCYGMHCFRLNYNYVKNYNNVYMHVSDNQIKYLESINSKPSSFCNSEPIKINKEPIKWLIRYKSD